MPFFAIKDVLIKKIKKSKIKKVQIVPMLLVSGNHYINDMVQIKDELNKTFDTKIVPSITEDSKFNLLSIPQIQDIIKMNIQEQIIKLGIN
jgi:sirohydrochlorin cobaltochelatase